MTDQPDRLTRIREELNERHEVYPDFSPAGPKSDALWLLAQLDRVRAERDRAVGLAVYHLALRTGRGMKLADARLVVLDHIVRGAGPDELITAALAEHDRRSTPPTEIKP